MAKVVLTFYSIIWQHLNISQLRHKLLDELPGHGHVEGPDLLSSGYDLCGRKEEAVGPSVPELHSVAVGDAKLSQSPVQ